MDGLSADKLRIFLNPVELETKWRKKYSENESAGFDEQAVAVTTLPTVADRRDQVFMFFSKIILFAFTVSLLKNEGVPRKESNVYMNKIYQN